MVIDAAARARVIFASARAGDGSEQLCSSVTQFAPRPEPHVE